jgi:hypothetical protein
MMVKESYSKPLFTHAAGKHALFLSSPFGMQTRKTQKMLERAIMFMAFGSSLYAASSELASSEAGPSVIGITFAILLFIYCKNSKGMVPHSTMCLFPAQEEGPDSMKAGVPISEDFEDPEKVMQQVEKGIEQRLKSLKLSASALSPYVVSAKGQQVIFANPVKSIIYFLGCTKLTDIYA